MLITEDFGTSEPGVSFEFFLSKTGFGGTKGAKGSEIGKT